jgi:hypothetical protein
MTPVFDKLVSALGVTPTCPRCKQVIPGQDVNVTNDIAFCRNCNLSCRLSGLTLGTAVDENVDETRPPEGTWFRRDGNGVVIGSTNRAVSQAFMLLVFCLFWNGIVSMFVFQAAVSTLKHLGLPRPAWFPVSKGPAMPVALTAFLWVFLTPFIAIGLAMVGAFLSCLAGRTELRIEAGQGVVFNGIGPIGFRKRFAASDVRDVRIEETPRRNGNRNARPSKQIVIETDGKPITFGSMLTDERRRFVAGAAKLELVGR